MSLLGAALMDVIIGAVILVSGFLSGLRGFAEELVTLLAWIVSLLVAFQFASPGAEYVPEALDSVSIGAITQDLTGFHAPLAGLVLFLATFILISQLHRLFGRMVDSGSVMRRGNRLLGFAFGLLRGALLVLVLVLIAGTTTITQQTFWHESRLLPYFVNASQQLIPWMPDEWQEHFHYPAATPSA